MTTPQVPPFDVNNSFLGPSPSALFAAEVPTSEGMMGAVTLRTSSATVTAFVNRDEMRTWGETLIKQANQMSGLIVPPPGASTPLPVVK